MSIRANFTNDIVTKSGPVVDARSYGDTLNDATITLASTAIGSSKITLLITPGTWTINDNLNLSNITVKFLPGTILSIASGKVLTLGIFSCQYRSQCFSGAGTVVFTSGLIGTLFPEWWGAIADGDFSDGSGTDCTDMLNACITAAYDIGARVKLAAGVYKITAAIGITKIAGSTSRQAFPTIEGTMTNDVHHTRADQTGSTIMMNGTGNALKIYNTDTTSYFEGGTLRDFKIVRYGSDKPTIGTDSIGINIRHWVDYRIYNVSIQGFYYGIFNFWGYSCHVFGLSCTRNNYGIWLDHNSNAISLNGVQAHQNNIGVRINAGYGIRFCGLTIEGQDVGLEITNNNAAYAGPYKVSIDTVYTEGNDDADILIGLDKDGTISTNTVQEVSLSNIYLSGTPTNFIALDNIDILRIYDIPSGQVSPITSITNNTKNVQILGQSHYSKGYLSNEKSVDQEVCISYPYNLIPNGFTNFPSTQFINHDLGIAGISWAVDGGRNVLKLTSENGDANTLKASIYVSLDPRMFNHKMSFSYRGKADSGLTVTAVAYNDAGAGISGFGAGPMTTSWDVYEDYMDAPASGNFIKIVFKTTNASGGSLYFYVENLILTYGEVSQIIQGPMDVLAGLSGEVTTDASGDATVTLTGRYFANRYNVFVSVNENTFAIARATKSNGSFVIKTVDELDANVGNIDVAWFVIPQQGIYLGY